MYILHCILGYIKINLKIWKLYHITGMVCKWMFEHRMVLGSVCYNWWKYTEMFLKLLSLAQLQQVASCILQWKLSKRKKESNKRKTSFGDLNRFFFFLLKTWFKSSLFGLNDFLVIIDIIINLLNNILIYNEIKWNCILKINTFTNLWIMNVIFNNYYYLYKLLLFIIFCKIQ